MVNHFEYAQCKHFDPAQCRQKGFAHILLILILLAGIGIAVYLTQFTQIFKPKASVEPIVFQGAGVSKAADGSWKTTTLSGLSVKLTSPITIPRRNDQQNCPPDTARRLGVEFNSPQDVNVNELIRKYGISMLTIESLKMAYLKPERNSTPNFSAADAVANFAAQNTLKSRGHTLIYPDATPPWLNNLTKEELQTFLGQYFNEVIGHFDPCVVVEWDVVNEALDENLANPQIMDNAFKQKLGDNYMDYMFQKAREVAGPNVKLYYNEDNAEAINGKSNEIYRRVVDMKSRGIPIDGVGFQGHTYTLSEESLKTFKENLMRFSNEGFDVRITEMDVAVSDGTRELTAPELQAQAEKYRKVAQICSEVPRCKGITTWGVTDNNAGWIDDFLCQGCNKHYYPFLFNRQNKPKPAYFAVADAFGIKYPDASGSITLSPALCTLSADQTTCPVTVSWETSNTSVASVYEYDNYKDGDLGVKKSNNLSGSFQVNLPAGRHYFNVFKTSNSSGVSDLLVQKWIDVTGGGTWSDNLVSTDLRNTTVSPSEAQKVQWFTGAEAVGTFKFTGNLAGDNSVIQVDVWGPNNTFVGTYVANQATFTNAAPNNFAVILRNQGSGITTFSNVSLVKQTNVLGVETASVQTTPYTKSFKISDSAGKLDSAPVQQYTGEGMVVPISFSDTNPGKKFIFVEFTGTNGEKVKETAAITYTPTVTNSPSPSPKPSVISNSSPAPTPTANVNVTRMEKLRLLQGSIPFYDTFYTTKQAEIDELGKQKYINKGVDFKTPTSGTSGSVAVKRIVKKVLLTDNNFVQVSTWAADTSDINALKSQGFAEEANNNFFVFTSQQPNTVGVTRLKIYSKEDNKTFYTFATSQTIITSLTNQGWQVDKANVFYVYP